MKYAPIARIILRYLSGMSFGGAALADRMGVDPDFFLTPDMVMIVAAGIGASVEMFYLIASKRGWTT